ncbi:MAG: AIR synthase family protein [Bellilinea sp.]
MTAILPVGKLPHELLERILRSAPTEGPRVLLGPGVGLDSAVLDFGENCLVVKTEPITFASDNIGWYAVQIAVNDIATSGALPSWAMFTLLLPEGSTTEASLLTITDQLSNACRSSGITIIGGHTEISHSLDRPIIVTTLLAEIAKDRLITPDQTRPGDALIVTKGVPIEATALLAREFPGFLQKHLTMEELKAAQNYLFDPGISVLKDAQTAIQAGKVTAMHDPTEGGVATALWELAQASQKTLLVNPDLIPISALSAKICRAFGLNPLGTIASGSLLLCVDPLSNAAVLSALQFAGVDAAEIGTVEAGEPEVLVLHGDQIDRLPRFDRDEIGRVYEEFTPG